MLKGNRRIRLVDESVNTYGFRLLMAGGDVAGFAANPVMFLNHQTDTLPIGTYEDIEVGATEITALPIFDEADPVGAQVGLKYNTNFIRAASVGVEIQEVSDDPALKLPGQTLGTVTKWRLREASIVNMPAVQSALALYDAAGKLVNLNDAGAIPELLRTQLKSETKDMNELALLAAALGLTGNNVALADVQKGIAELKDKAAKYDVLKAQVDAQAAQAKLAEKAEATNLLDTAVAEGRLNDESRTAYAALFDANHAQAKVALSAIPKPTALANFADKVKGGTTGFTYQGKTYRQLFKEGGETLANLKQNDPDAFKRLYKAEYGTDWKE